MEEHGAPCSDAYGDQRRTFDQENLVELCDLPPHRRLLNHYRKEIRVDQALWFVLPAEKVTSETTRMQHD